MKRGEEHGIAKLTWEEVKAIRRRYSDGETQDALADAFGSSQANVRRIIQNEQWVVENPDWIVRENHWWPGRRGEDNNFTRLTQKQVDEIRERYKRGERQKELAKAFGVNHGTISLIIRNETWVVENPVVTSRGQEHIRGDDNPTAKLTFRKARKIRELSKDGWTYKELKEEFGVETGTISRVLRNQRWIDKDYKPRPPIPRSERWKMRVRYREENGVKNGISGT
jgi:transcriptional regulator with XRE-family HTH domain